MVVKRMELTTVNVLSILSISLIIFQVAICEERQVRLVYSVNAGGPDHTDIHGIFYRRDTLTEGVASDYGNRLTGVGRTRPQDEILYRTERYSDKTFGYNFQLFGDGQYVLVMKFAEVYFQSAGQKVFDILLNKKHTIVEELDIYSLVGFGTAHQIVVPFTVEKGATVLTVQGKSSAIKNNQLRLEFVKGRYDNPKINAFYVVKGTIDDIPQLPAVSHNPHPSEEDMDMDDEDEEYLDLGSFTENLNNREGPGRSGGFRRYKRSGASHIDPWEDQSLMTMLYPLIVAAVGGLVSVSISVKLFRGI